MKIHTLDLYFQDLSKAIASYLVEGPTGYLLIETGPGSTINVLLERLEEKGLELEDVRHVFVTHIHLDHAGAAGWLAQKGARVYVHHRGAPHLVDPTRLLSSAKRIYGDKMDSLWGETVRAPAEKITALTDGQTVNAAGLVITALDTPGHAYHHLVYVLEDTAFTGDAAGIRIEGTSLVDLPAPPPEFNLDLWQETIRKLQAYRFDEIYPTHFGRVTDPEVQLAALAELMLEAANFVKQRIDKGEGRQEIMSHYLEWHHSRAVAAGCFEEDLVRGELANPHYMSVDGILRYWRKLAEQDDKENQP